MRVPGFANDSTTAAQQGIKRHSDLNSWRTPGPHGTRPKPPDRLAVQAAVTQSEKSAVRVLSRPTRIDRRRVAGYDFEDGRRSANGISSEPNLRRHRRWLRRQAAPGPAYRIEDCRGPGRGAARAQRRRGSRFVRAGRPHGGGCRSLDGDDGPAIARGRPARSRGGGAAAVPRRRIRRRDGHADRPPLGGPSGGLRGAVPGRAAAGGVHLRARGAQQGNGSSRTTSPRSRSSIIAARGSRPPRWPTASGPPTW
jgi:hypothetical protein